MNLPDSIEQLHSMIVGGYVFSIENGRLLVSDPMGATWPRTTYEKNKEWMLEAICKVTDTPLMVYSFYSTGTNAGHSSDRLTLRFIEAASQETVLLHFNVNTRQIRRGKSKEAGSKKKSGAFTPPKNGAFIKFWRTTGLERPRWPSEYNRKMRLLSGLIFSGEVEISEAGNRVKDKKLTTINMLFREIEEATDQFIGRFMRGESVESTVRNGGDNEEKESGEATCATPVYTRAASDTHYASGKARLKLCDYRDKPQVLSKFIRNLTTEEWLEDNENGPDTVFPPLPKLRHKQRENH